MNPVKPCRESACIACPWRASNQGKPSTFRVENERYGWYDTRNLRRLWKGLRNGERMTCHPTDPDHAEQFGLPSNPGAATVECAGATILVQREFMLFQSGGGNVRQYRKASPHGLTLTGLREIATAELFGGVLGGHGKMGRPDLSDPDICYAPLVNK